MHLLALTACLLLVVKMSEAAVAVGVGRLNPGEKSFEKAQIEKSSTGSKSNYYRLCGEEEA